MIGKSPAKFDPGNIVRSTRIAAGLSRVELAKRADLAHSTVYLLEEGLVGDVYVSTLLKLAYALEVSPERLLGRVAV